MHQGKWRKKFLTKLPVRKPGIAVFVKHKGRRIQKDRLPAGDKKIKRCGIFQDHPIPERHLVDL